MAVNPDTGTNFVDDTEYQISSSAISARRALTAHGDFAIPFLSLSLCYPTLPSSPTLLFRSCQQDSTPFLLGETHMSKRKRNAHHIYMGEEEPTSTALDAIHVVVTNQHKRARVLQKTYGVRQLQDVDESLSPPAAEFLPTMCNNGPAQVDEGPVPPAESDNDGQVPRSQNKVIFLNYLYVTTLTPRGAQR